MGTGTAAAANKKDISVQDGQKITAEAASWRDTPYALLGAAAKKGTGGDCSGTTFKIYDSAGFAYTYSVAHGFPEYATKSGLFRELKAGEDKQDGDILSWPNHMAIYSTFSTSLETGYAVTKRKTKDGKGTWDQNNDAWTASHPGGPAYAPAEMKWWRPDAPKVFRYQQ